MRMVPRRLYRQFIPPTNTMKKLLLLFVLFSLASCGDDDAQPTYTGTGTMSLKIDNVSYVIDNPVVDVQGSFLYFVTTMDGFVYFPGTSELRYSIHMQLEQHGGGFSIAAYDLMVKKETPDGYAVKNYHAYANGTAVSNWMQSGFTSNDHEPRKKTEASGEFSGYTRENGAPAEEEIYISGDYSFLIQ